MRYKAKIVRDDELPESVDRVIVQHDSDDPVLLIKESAAPPVFQWHERNGTDGTTRRAWIRRSARWLLRRAGRGALWGLRTLRHRRRA